MTSRYSPINQHDALYNSARRYPGGVEALAARLGKTEAVLYQKLRPAVSSHYPSFEEATHIMEICAGAGDKEAHQSLRAMAWRMGYVVVKVPASVQVGDEEMLEAVCKSVQEHGDAVAVIGEVLRDGVVSKQEYDQVNKEIEEAMAALAALRSMVELKKGAK